MYEYQERIMKNNDEHKSIDLIDFKTWLLTEYVNTEAPQVKDYFTEFVMKVRLDCDWPTVDITLSQLLEYVGSKETDDITKVQLVIAWTRYVDTYASLITSKEMHDMKKLERSPLRNFLQGEDRALFNNTIKRITKIERACCCSGSFEDGISWKTRL